MIDLKAVGSTVQIKHHAATLLGDHAHRLVERLAATAIGGKQIACCAAGMHAHQHSPFAGRPSVGIEGSRLS